MSGDVIDSASEVVRLEEFTNAVKTMANLMFLYREALVSEGFTEAEAMSLLIAYQRSIVRSNLSE